MDDMNIERCGTLARTKTRLRSNTRRHVVQGNCLKIYFALCPCLVVAENTEEEPGATALNINTTAGQAGTESLFSCMDWAHPQGLVPLASLLVATCSAARHWLCRDLPSHLLSRHSKESRWALTAKGIGRVWGTMGCWTEVLGQKKESKMIMTKSMASHIQPLPFF